MASKNKKRGNKLEYEIVEMAKSLGFEAKRAWASDGRSMGEDKEVDVLIDNGWKVQAKRRKKLASYLIPAEGIDFNVVREDRGRPLAIIDLRELLLLLRRTRADFNYEENEVLSFSD